VVSAFVIWRTWSGSHVSATRTLYPTHRVDR
jgi:hypothetical protein